MAKRNKPGKYHKKKKPVVEEKVYEYKDYIAEIKNLKKYTESIDYLSLFAQSLEDDTIQWKFKSNLQTFIKKHILIKDIFGSKPFQHFQYYFEKMAGNKEFLKSCEDIIEKINKGEGSKLPQELLIYKIKPLEDDLEAFIEKLKKRCIILIENN